MLSVLVDRCPGCNNAVAEADDVCPHCGRDFTAPVARKPVVKPPPDRAPEPPPEPDPAAAPVPAPKPEDVPERPAPKKAPVLAPEDPPAPEKKAEKKTEKEPDQRPKPKPRLEEREVPVPAPEPEPSLSPNYEIENPQAYVPGQYNPGEDSYQVKKEAVRPPWHWLAMAVVCIVAFKVFNPKGPLLVTPEDAPKPAPTAPQPAAPVHVPGDIVGAVRALSDAKDAAAAANAAATPPPLTTALPKPPREQHREVPEPVDPDDVDRTPDDSPILITQTGVQDPPRRRGGPTASKEWRMRGAIFDLVTGDPVKSADVVFMDAKTGRRFATGTDAQGRYRATLPVTEEGYDLNIRHPRYEPKYFEDGIPSYRELAVEQRQSAASDLMRILQTKELIVGVGGAVIERDFVVIPLNRP